MREYTPDLDFNTPMSSLSPTAVPYMRPPPISVPRAGENSPMTPPTAAGNRFVNVHDEKDGGVDSDGQEELYTMPYAETQEKKKGAAVFGVQRGKKKVNDPFDFVERLPEDPPYEEMGETARLWKIFLQERGKVDTDNVQNWKDALDVLLVFAGLFSAVVSSFVLETYQTLQVDNVQVIALLVVELVGLQRATDASTVPATDITPLTDFRPARSAVWVNGMWFVSLVLSLTAATVAGLTKQWVNEYINSATQVGTPRTLSRIRQFRAIQLEAWHVPVIIGLLPVLMHVSLGIFLAGLIVFLFTLSTPLAVAISVVAAGTLVTYLATNILPLYNPSCPYKTPLTNYLYSAYYYIRHLDLSIRHLKQIIPTAVLGRPSVDTPDPSSSEDADERIDIEDTEPGFFGWTPIEAMMPSSLKEAEERMVVDQADYLDGQVSVWLYNASANTSIHRAVIEGISNVPLSAVKVVRKGIYDLRVVIRSALQSIDVKSNDSMPAYDRLLRSLLRFFPEDDMLATYVPEALDFNGTSLAVLLDRSRPQIAAKYLEGQMRQWDSLHDVAAWAQILRNALSCGVDFLDVDQPGSLVTATLRSWLAAPHMCADCAQRYGSAGDVYAVELWDGPNHPPSHGGQSLIVLDNPSASTGTISIGTTSAISFKHAVENFLLPSLSDLVFRLDIFPPCDSQIPSDIQLHLSLIRSPVVRRTSESDDEKTLAGKTITCIQESVGIIGDYDTHIRHSHVTSATFSVLAHIFECDTLLSPHDGRRLLHALIRSLLLDQELEACYRTWISNVDTADRLVNIVFGEFWDLSVVGPLLTDLFQFCARARCTALLPQIYARLTATSWLSMLPNPILDVKDADPAGHDEREVSFLVANFLRALDVLGNIAPVQHKHVLAYIQEPETLVAISKVLVLADIESRQTLHIVASLVPTSLWLPCLKGLAEFTKEKTTLKVYALRRLHVRHPQIYGRCLVYDSAEGMTSYCANLRQSCSNMDFVSALATSSFTISSSFSREQTKPADSESSEGHEMV